MDPIGGVNPTKPQLSTQNAPAANADIVPPAPVQGSGSGNVPTAPGLEAPASATSTPKKLSDFHFEDTESTPTPQPPASLGTPPVVTAEHHNTAKTDDKTPKPKPIKHGGGTSKKVLLWLLILILIIGAGAGGYVYGLKVGKDKTLAEVQKEKDAATKTQTENIPDVTDETDENDLAVGDLTTPTYADESITGKVNQQMNANDGLIIKVTSVERDYKTTDPNYKIETGKELVRVTFLLGNATLGQAKDITPNNFRLLDSTGAQKTAEVLSGYPNKFDTFKIEPGKIVKGSIVYKVEEDETPLSLVREQQYKIATGNKTVTTKITIGLDSTTDS